jgi:hypothetical protein
MAVIPKATSSFWSQHHILSNILLVDQWTDFGPWYIILKVLLSAMLALGINLGTQCQDNISATFTAFLVVSPVVSQGLRTGFHVFWAGILGSTFGMISLAIWGLANSPNFPSESLPWLRVPLTMAAATYALFVLNQFGNPPAATTAVFSALYVQLAAVPYPPMSADPIWAQVLVTRILALSTGVLAATVVNILLSGLFYTWIFRNQEFSIERQMLQALPVLLRGDFEGEFIFSSLISRIHDGEAAQQELSWLSCDCGTKTRLAQTNNIRLANYVEALKLYLQLASLYGFSGKCHRRILVPTNGDINWDGVLEEIMQETVVKLSERLGWPPLSSSTLGPTLAEKIFACPVPVLFNAQSTQFKSNLMSDIIQRVMIKRSGSPQDVHPFLQSLLMSLTDVAAQLINLYDSQQM